MSPRRDEPPAPRLLATLLAGVLFTVLSTTLFAWWSVGPLRLRPMVVVIVSAGFRLPLGRGGLLVLALAYLNDLLSGGIIGLNAVSYMVVFAACAVAQRKLQIESWPFQMMTVGVMSVVMQLLVVVGLMLTRWEHLVPENLYWVVGAQALLSALTAPLFFGLLEFLVRLVGRFWPKERRVGA